MTSIQGLGFDLDGTLVNSIGISVRLVAEAAGEVGGRPFAADEVIRQFGQPEARALAALCPRHPAEAFAAYQRLVSANINEYSLFDGVREMLETLAAQLPLGLYTTRGRWSTDQILHHLDLKKYFRLVVAGEDVTLLKPDPEGVLLVARGLEVLPEQMLYCGDSEGDLLAARAARSAPLQVLWGKETVPVLGFPSVQTVTEFRARLSL